MWQLEQVPKAPQHSPEELSALQHFEQSVTIQADGRYSVSLPRVKDPPALGKSRKMAVSRFLGNERSLRKKDKLEPYN